MSSAIRRRTPRAARPVARLTLATFLPYRLNVVAAVVSDGLAKTYAERFGIGIPEWRIVATLGEFGSLTAKAIGAHAHMGKVRVSRAATALEDRGLIRRLPNADDLREAFLILTPSGQSIYRDIAPLALAYVDKITAGFTPAERAQFDRLMDKLLEADRTLART